MIRAVTCGSCTKRRTCSATSARKLAAPQRSQICAGMPSTTNSLSLIVYIRFTFPVESIRAADLTNHGLASFPPRSIIPRCLLRERFPIEEMVLYHTGIIAEQQKPGYRKTPTKRRMCSCQFSLEEKPIVNNTTLDRIRSESSAYEWPSVYSRLALDSKVRAGGVGNLPGSTRTKCEYPELEDEDIRQALAYAATSLDDKVLELPVGR